MISPKQQTILANELRTLALIFNHDTTKEVIQAYVRVLSKYNFDATKKAIAWAVENCKFFPKPAELIERISPAPTREDADAIAGRAIEAIKRFGWNNSKEAQLFIGPEGWKAVSRCGGWRTLCEGREDQLGTLRAQLRDQSLAVLNDREVSRRESLRIEKNYGINALGSTQAARAKKIGVTDPGFMNDEGAVRQREFDQEKDRQLNQIKKLDFKKQLEEFTDK